MDLDTAQDITQDVFVKIYEKRQLLEIHTSLKAYLYTAVRNNCFDHLKIHKIHQRHKDQIKQESSDLVIEDDDTVDQIELQDKIYKAIQTLPEQNQKIFKLSRFEAKTNQEIAELLNISKRTVETHISNALKKIKSLVLLVFISLVLSIL